MRDPRNERGRRLMVRAIWMGVTLGMLSGCASVQNIPMTVQSDPLGAHVLYQVRGAVAGSGDWIYLGVTPVDVNRAISSKNLNDADAFILRIVKEGYLDQVREWSGAALSQEIDDKGRVFWNPRLVKIQN